MIDRLGINATETNTEAQKDATGTATHLAKLNIVNSCFSAVDDAIAIIAQREGADNLVTLTYHELACLTESSRKWTCRYWTKTGRCRGD